MPDAITPASSPITIIISATGVYTTAVSGKGSINDLALTGNMYSFNIFNATIFPNTVRDKTTHNIYFYMPKSKLIKNAYMWVEFFKSPYPLIWSPQCKLIRQ